MKPGLAFVWYNREHISTNLLLAMALEDKRYQACCRRDKRLTKQNSEIIFTLEDESKALSSSCNPFTIERHTMYEKRVEKSNAHMRRNLPFHATVVPRDLGKAEAR